jgi:hypothetical protein
MPVLPGTLVLVGCNAPACYWTIKVADFSFRADSVPSISNIQTIKPPSNFFMRLMVFPTTTAELFFAATSISIPFLMKIFTPLMFPAVT